MRYGIPQCILPIDVSGNLKAAFPCSPSLDEPLQGKRTERNQIDNTIEPQETISSNDVLLGRGLGKAHPGNLKLTTMIQMRRKEYEKKSKFEKTCIAMLIVDEIKASNGRFLRRRGSGSRRLVEISDLEARRSIIHRFRNIPPHSWKNHLSQTKQGDANTEILLVRVRTNLSG